MNDFVYPVFEEKPTSCDRDYGEDGFIIVWDSEEIGRNISTTELIEIIKTHDEELYSEVIKYLLNDFNLIYEKKKQYLDEHYFEEIFEFLESKIGEGTFYRFYYQNIPFLKEIHSTEESAKKRVEYYTENHPYMNKHYYSKQKLFLGVDE